METFNSILEFQKHFDTDEKCRQFLEFQRWGDKPACLHCGSTHVARLKDGKRFQCNEQVCRKQFTVTVGTVAHSSKIPLHKWFLGMYILSNHSKGISSLQLAKWLDISQKAAWHLNHRIREMLCDNAPEFLSGIVEVDECWVGGKISNKHVSKRKHFGKNDNKTMVFGALQRGGKVVNKVVPDTTKETLINVVKETVEEGSIMVSDENVAYTGLKKTFKHVTVNHSKEEYVRGKAHTNSIEGYWSLLKRQIVGIHHSVSGKHLQRYCNESAYRYNAKNESQYYRFVSTLINCEKRLKYTDLTK